MKVSNLNSKSHINDGKLIKLDQFSVKDQSAISTILSIDDDNVKINKILNKIPNFNIKTTTESGGRSLTKESKKLLMKFAVDEGDEVENLVNKKAQSSEYLFSDDENESEQKEPITVKQKVVIQSQPAVKHEPTQKKVLSEKILTEKNAQLLKQQKKEEEKQRKIKEVFGHESKPQQTKKKPIEKVKMRMVS